MRRLQTTIAEIGWTRDIPRLKAADAVHEAFAVMNREAHDCVLVVEKDRPVGIFTSRDFLDRIAAARRDPKQVTLGEVMTRSPRTFHTK
jgi:CBS domain-containing protein